MNITTDGTAAVPLEAYPTPPDVGIAQARPPSPTDRFIQHDEHVLSPTRALPSFQNLAVADTLPPMLSIMPSFEMEPPPLDPEAAALRSQLYHDQDVWPLQDREEAMLFRHYIQKLSIWLDVCDMCQSFETVVPTRAGRCKVLLNAILALSAKHLAHTTTNYDPYASDRYHQACLAVLIPILAQQDEHSPHQQHHNAPLADENLFAATIILRVWEEMEVKASGVDAHSYLLGIKAFVHHGTTGGGGGASGVGDGSHVNALHHHPGYLMPGSLSGAAFWVGLRQEIYSAVMNQAPVRINLVHSLVDRSLLPTDDFGWANRAVVHCADVLNFCFGDGAQGALGRAGGIEWWCELDEYNRRWTESLPGSFTPIYQRAPQLAKGEVFPEIWYQSACHGASFILRLIFSVLFPRLFVPRREWHDHGVLFADAERPQHSGFSTICWLSCSWSALIRSFPGWARNGKKRRREPM